MSYLIKLDLVDDGHKCYTNVTSYKFTEGFLVFTIESEGKEIVKAIPSSRIKHTQIE